MNENLNTYKKIIYCKTDSFTAKIFHFEEIDSTNTFLKKYFQSEKAKTLITEKLSHLEGVGALADFQSSGRGRMERKWVSPLGEGLYFSILLMPKIDFSNITLISLMTAIAVAETLMAFCDIKIDIKWPNDILINKKKVSGILIESAFDGNNLSYVIIGIGVNLLQKDFPPNLNLPATSLFLETGLIIEKEEFLLALVKHLAKWYKILMDQSDKIVDKWEELSSFAYGKKIKVKINSNEETVFTTMGLNFCGALKVKSIDGKECVLYGNEITSFER
jgi:BirA family biotin operon repressor/biotin-[acetyl-CoA-carboxylase] ligase